MAKSRAQKELTLATVTEKYGKAKSAVFIDYTGLTVADVTELRKKCKEQGAEYLVAKKTLFRKALEQQGMEIGSNLKVLQGNLGAIFGYEDEITPARITKEFGKGHEKMAVRAGIMEGKFIDVAMVKALSSLPSKQELLGKLVGSINAPVSGFVNVLAGNLRGFVRVLDAVRAQKS